jgi:hypothetical protein
VRLSLWIEAVRGAFIGPAIGACPMMLGTGQRAWGEEQQLDGEEEI